MNTLIPLKVKYVITHVVTNVSLTTREHRPANDRSRTILDRKSDPDRAKNMEWHGFYISEQSENILKMSDTQKTFFAFSFFFAFFWIDNIISVHTRKKIRS